MKRRWTRCSNNDCVIIIAMTNSEISPRHKFVYAIRDCILESVSLSILVRISFFRIDQKSIFHFFFKITVLPYVINYKIREI